MDYYSQQAPQIPMKDYLPPDVLAMLDPFWHHFPPQKPIFYTVMAIVYLVLGFLSIAGNLLVLWIFSKFPSLRTPTNMMVMNLAFCDLMIGVTMIPETIYNFLMGGVWQFGTFGCQLHAFCGSIFGTGQIATLIFISYDRYNVIVNGLRGEPLTYSKVAVFMLFIWGFSTVCALGPLVGYGIYALDGTLATCSFGFTDQSITNVVYIINVCIAAYLLPLLSIIFFYFNIVKAVIAHEKSMKDQAKKMNVASLKSKVVGSRLSIEVKIAKAALLNVTLWVLCWTPFATICFMGVLGYQQGLTPFTTSLPVLFAKSSSVYNPIIYSLSHPRFIKHLKKIVPWNQVPEGGNNSIISEIYVVSETKKQYMYA